MQTAKVEGNTVKIGDYVCFKSDFEQCGKIVEIIRGTTLVLFKDDHGFAGDYIGGENYTRVDARDCWIE
jgi:hypothetical protein